FGVQVLTDDGYDVSPRRAIVRTLVFPLSFLILGLGFLGILLGDQRRALHDVIAGTVVVYAWDARAARLRFLSRESSPGADRPAPPALPGPPASPGCPRTRRPRRKPGVSVRQPTTPAFHPARVRACQSRTASMGAEPRRSDTEEEGCAPRVARAVVAWASAPG